MAFVFGVAPFTNNEIHSEWLVAGWSCLLYLLLGAGVADPPGKSEIEESEKQKTHSALFGRGLVEIWIAEVAKAGYRRSP